MDPFFGRAVTAFPALANQGSTVIPLAGGKVLVGGATSAGFGIARFNADGSPDPSFGGGDGQAIGYGETGMTRLPDGRILVAGQGLGLARYLPDGSPDPTFGGGDGVALALTPWSADAQALALLTDGKVLVAGAGKDWYDRGCWNPDLTLVRFNPDGTLDGTFGDQGVRTAPAGSFAFGYYAHGLSVLPSGKVLFYTDSSYDGHTRLVRYNDDFTLDATFGGGDGIVTDFGPYAGDLTSVLPDGTILSSPGWTAGDFVLTRLTSDGRPDATFGTGGVARADFGAIDVLTSIAPAPDGGVFAAGYAHTGNWYAAPAHFAVARFRPDGTLDPAFSPGGAEGDGRAVIDIGGPRELAHAVAVTPTGGVLAAGSSTLALTDATSATNLAVVRLRADGSLDGAFSGDGRLTARFTARAPAGAVLGLPEGRVVAAGGYEHGFALTRYRTDGSLDPTFGPGGFFGTGRVVTSFGGGLTAGGDARVVGLAALPGGKLLAGGSTGSSFALARYNADGSPDPTFGLLGSARSGTAGLAASSPATAWAVLPDGKVYLAGSSPNGTDDEIVSFARFNADGTPDTDFGPDGTGSMTMYQPAASQWWGHVVAVAGLADGGLLAVVAPDSYYEAGCFLLFLLKLRPDGSPDTRFGPDGWRATAALPAATAAALLPDGRLLVTGESAGLVALARFNPDGSLDRTFARGGTDGDGVLVDFAGSAPTLTLSLDGKFLVTAASGGDFVVARYLADGTRDPAFTTTTGGTARVDFGPAAAPRAIALAPDGGVLLAGSTEPGPGDGIRFDARFAVARLIGDEPPAGQTLTVEGTAGPDRIAVTRSGGTLIATLNGQVVANRPLTGLASLVLKGLAGNDTLDVANAITLPATLDGGDGNDLLKGGGGADTLLSGDGDDVLDGRKGADVFSGGAGRDVADYSSRTKNVSVGPGKLADDGEVGEGDNVRADVEDVYGGKGNDYLNGSAADNRLFGGPGDDVLIGNGGRDTLVGGAGNDRLFSRDGIKDTWIDGGLGTDAARSDAADILASIELKLP